MGDYQGRNKNRINYIQCFNMKSIKEILSLKEKFRLQKKTMQGHCNDRMMQLGAGLVLGSVDLLVTGNVRLIPQDDLKASHAPKIQHHDAHINWHADRE
jgi:methionyl-tRNA formyltransferase